MAEPASPAGGSPTPLNRPGSGGFGPAERSSGTPMLRTRLGPDMDMAGAQSRLQNEYASIQRRAKELMATMDIPGAHY